ncbi:MAG: methyltransferase domain-containing protein [Rhodanobacter sp.]|jgi:ubiquinone/menaquinone biosynthesis C-methylase UbiE/uncharacterized protein YbaR (Trm112 family)
MNNTPFPVFVCPQCKKSLTKGTKHIVCAHCHITYPIQSGIPVFLPSFHSSHIEKQIEYFKHEKHTTSFHYTYEPWQKRYVQFFLRAHVSVKGQTFIDIGTGSGYMTIELAKKGAFVIACDVTIENLLRLKHIAKQKGLDSHIRYVCSSAESLPLSKTSLDGVIINAVLEHLEREKETISEIGRVLKKRGVLMITVPLLYRYIFPLFIPIHIVYDKKIGHLRRYSLGLLEQKLQGWKTVSVRYSGHIDKMMKTLGNYFFRRIWDEEAIEKADDKKSHVSVFASNISLIAEKI